MLSRFQAAGGKVNWTKYTDEEVSGVFSHPSGGSVEVSWTTDRAKRAGLANRDTWKQYPRQMLKARVISEGVRMVLPGVVSGLYAPEEVAEFDAAPPATPPATDLVSLVSDLESANQENLQATFTRVWKAAKAANASEETLDSLITLKNKKKNEVQIHSAIETTGTGNVPSDSH